MSISGESTIRPTRAIVKSNTLMATPLLLLQAKSLLRRSCSRYRQPAFLQERPVQIDQFTPHNLLPKFVLYSFTPSVPHASSYRRIRQQLTDRIGQRARVAHRNQNTACPIQHGIDGACSFGGDNRPLCRLRLEHSIREAFAIGWQDEDIHRQVIGSNIGLEWNNLDAQTGIDARAHFQLNRIPLLVAANEQEGSAGELLAYQVECGRQLGDALVSGETSDEANHRTGTKLQDVTNFCRSRCSRRRRNEASHINAIAASRSQHNDLVRVGEFQLDGTITQAGAHADHTVGTTTGDSLRREENHPCQPAGSLDAQSSHGVYATGNASQPRREHD